MNPTPQLENGYIRIANEIVDALMKINISCYQMRVLLCIFRKTYGYNKKEDWISVSQIVTSTGIYKAHVSRAKSELLKRHLVTSNGNKITFQKDSSLWCELPKEVTVTSTGRKVTSTGQKLPQEVDTKDNIQKTITKYNINSIIPYFEKVNPSYKRMFANTSQRSSLQRLVDQYGEDRIKNLLIQLPSIIQRPYAPRITTPYELEAKMGQLIAFMKQESIKINKGGVTRV